MDGLGAYLHASGEKPLLSPTSERRLARRARAGSKKAKDELVERNLRLVIPTAKKFRGQGQTRPGIVQRRCGAGTGRKFKCAERGRFNVRKFRIVDGRCRRGRDSSAPRRQRPASIAATR